MNEIKRPDDLSSLNADQIHELAAVVREDCGDGLVQTTFTECLLLLLEDVSGFEAGEIPASLIDAAWVAYNQSASPSK
ncbi:MULTISPECIES: hypothetical protein [Burkholderia cepacia complex]|uniref:hypothetical protein n=1 Tax=Burkholderia cepacia complex TaxID=87882 RepID=UPI0009B41AF8|nr:MULTISPECIES: hypothetical protein [Burkholderia cepacia complex]